MIPKTLHVVLVAFCLVCAGCRQKNIADLSPGVHNDPVVVEFSRQDGRSKHIAGEKKNLDENTDESTVIAYYFHRTIRCVACITVEATTASVIENSFQQQIADGRLMWMRVNLDDRDGSEYEEQFDISGSALVIAKAGNGNQLRHKTLTKVWELLSKPQALSGYIEGEIKEYLNQ